jgi:hypothetical protein
VVLVGPLLLYRPLVQMAPAPLEGERSGSIRETQEGPLPPKHASDLRHVCIGWAWTGRDTDGPERHSEPELLRGKVYSTPGRLCGGGGPTTSMAVIANKGREGPFCPYSGWDVKPTLRTAHGGHQLYPWLGPGRLCLEWP